MTLRTHALDIYGVHIALATSKRDWKQLREGYDFMGRRPRTQGMATFHKGHLVLWVDVNCHESTGDLVDTIAHEAVHGARQILDWVEYHGCDEPFAYLVGWLARFMWDGVSQ